MVVSPRIVALAALAPLVFIACGGRVAATPTDRDVPDSSDAGVTVPSDASTDGGSVPDTQPDANPILAPCLVSSYAVVHFEGDPGDPLFSGNVTYTYEDTAGTWDLGLVNSNSHTTGYDAMGVSVDFMPGLYAVAFSVSLPAKLHVGVYENAQGRGGVDGGIDPNRPRLSLIAGARLCDDSTARFEILQLETKGEASSLMFRALATFESQCAGSSTKVRGCVRAAQY